jgi:hypothetical protein
MTPWCHERISIELNPVSRPSIFDPINAAIREELKKSTGTIFAELETFIWNEDFVDLCD